MLLKTQSVKVMLHSSTPRQMNHCQKAYSNKTSLWVIDFICEFMANIWNIRYSCCNHLLWALVSPVLARTCTPMPRTEKGWGLDGSALGSLWHAAQSLHCVFLSLPCTNVMTINWALILMCLKTCKSSVWPSFQQLYKFGFFLLVFTDGFIFFLLRH